MCWASDDGINLILFHGQVSNKATQTCQDFMEHVLIQALQFVGYLLFKCKESAQESAFRIVNSEQPLSSLTAQS